MTVLLTQHSLTDHHDDLQPISSGAAEADNADNSNLTQEPSNKDQTQQPPNPTPTPSHHTPLHTPPYHSTTTILQQGPEIISP